MVARIFFKRDRFFRGKKKKGKSRDANTMRLIRIYLEYPKCLFDQIELTRHNLHQKVTRAIVEFADKKLKNQ